LLSFFAGGARTRLVEAAVAIRDEEGAEGSEKDENKKRARKIIKLLK
jgi:hypothetical protein